MPKSPRYTTFASGELEDRLREMAPDARFFRVSRSVGEGRIGMLLKEHRFTVSLPDGTQSACCYERLASQYHRFDYVYADGTPLPRQNLFERLVNDVKTIEEKGRERAEACFRDATLWERREYFARASEPSDGSRKKRPEKYRLQAKVARELGGYYAVCRRSQMGLLPVGVAYPTLEKANAAWKEAALPETVVACCNRLDRCWETPRFNPLYAECEMRDSVLAALQSHRKEDLDHEPV